MAWSMRTRRTSMICLLAALTAGCSDDEEGSSSPGPDAGVTGDAATGGDGATDVPSLFSDREPDATVTASGPSGRIDIARDELGIPHVYAKTIPDGAFAMGYLHAADRLAMMDLFRHLVMGRLSEYLGAGLADTDTGAGKRQLHDVRRKGRQRGHRAPGGKRPRNDVAPVPAIGKQRDRHAERDIEQGECRPGEKTQDPVRNLELRTYRGQQYCEDLAIHEVEYVGRRQQPEDVVSGSRRPGLCRR